MRWKEKMSFKYDPNKHKSNAVFSQRCWHSHPPYVLKCKDGEYTIIGGSCTNAYPENVDVFIGFDSGMVYGDRGYPWVEGTDVFFKIRDRGVPSSVKNFKKLIDWTADQLRNDKRVFCGCIGGHGRTGLFLAALTKVMTGEKDAITFVRKNYCKKAVESVKQVDWLVKNFKIKKVSGSDTVKKTTGEVPWGGSDIWDKSFQKNTTDMYDPHQYTESGLVSEEAKTKFHPMSGHSEFTTKKHLDK